MLSLDGDAEDWTETDTFNGVRLDTDALDTWMSQTAIVSESWVIPGRKFPPINLIIRRVLRGALTGALIGTSTLLVLYGLIHFSVI